MAENNSPDVDSTQTFVSHLIELRDRLLRCILAVVVIFLTLFVFANDIYTALAGPLLKHLPEGSTMIAIEVASPFLTPFKLVLVLSIFLAVPVILYQLWAFVAPGLYQNERRLVVPLLISSTALFYAGMAFAYFVVFPLVFGFLTRVAPEGVAMMTDISKYLDFVLTLFFAFGVAFEVPIATLLLVLAGATTPESLAQKRPYIIVAAFVTGMFLTPPDIISQTLLALPMWLLFELGLILSRMVIRNREATHEKNELHTPATATAATPTSNTLAERSEWHPLTEEEMEAELDSIEAEEGDGEDKPPSDDAGTDNNDKKDG